MKAILRTTLLFAAIFILAVTGSWAQRVLKGTIYMDGEPAAGITVEVHKGGKMMTSFDGKYSVEADEKSKWIRFTFIDESKKESLEGITGDVYNYAFKGELPSANGGSKEVVGDVVLKSADELVQEQNKDFMNEYSLHREFYKQDDYKSALPHWKALYNRYPMSTPNVYIQGIIMYESFIEKAKTDEEKDKLLDELMQIFDKRVEHFGQEGYVIGRKGTSWLDYKINPEKRNNPLEGDQLKEAIKTGYGWVNESVNLQGKETELPILVLLMQTTRSLFKLGELPKETVVVNYERINKILNEIISENAEAERTADARDKIQPYIENLFGTSGAADCEALINIFTPQFQEKGNDVEYIKEMLRRLRRAKCDESELVEQATIRLYELEPSAEAAFNMARRYLKKDDMENARKYYEQAISQETDPMLLASYHYERGLLRYAKLNDLPGAREEARKALSLNPDMCEANMLLGDIYVAASRNFSGTNLEKSAIFWVAVDYFNKARRGEDCSIDAANKVSDFKKYFPNKEDAFMEGLQAGQSYKVGGWINETTTVRF